MSFGLAFNCCCEKPCIIWSDDFNRDDDTNIGTLWTEDSGSWAIVDNKLKCTSAGSIRTVAFPGNFENGLRFKVTAKEDDVIRFGWKKDFLGGFPAPVIGRHWEIKFGPNGWLKFKQPNTTTTNYGCDYEFPADEEITIEMRRWAIYVNGDCIWNADYSRQSSSVQFQLDTVTVDSEIIFDDIEIFKYYKPYKIGSDGIDQGAEYEGDEDCPKCLPCHWFTQTADNLPATIDLEFDGNWKSNDNGDRLYANLIGNYTLNHVSSGDLYYPCRWELDGLNINIGPGSYVSRHVTAISFEPFNESGYLYGAPPYDRPKHMVSLKVRRVYLDTTTEDRWCSDLTFSFIGQTNYANYSVGSPCENDTMIHYGAAGGGEPSTVGGVAGVNLRGDVIVTK